MSAEHSAMYFVEKGPASFFRAANILGKMLINWKIC